MIDKGRDYNKQNNKQSTKLLVSNNSNNYK